MRMHLLIADDYPDNAASLADFFEMALDGRLTADVALDGGQAVRFAEHRRPDVAFLDIAMPVMDGVAAGLRIRQMYQRQVLLVAMSGQREHVQAARESGHFDHALHKPVELNKLLDIIETWTRTQGRAD